MFRQIVFTQHNIYPQPELIHPQPELIHPQPELIHHRLWADILPSTQTTCQKEYTCVLLIDAAPAGIRKAF
jgi:hypothetical protein